MKRIFKGLKIHIWLLILLSSLYSYLSLLLANDIRYAIDDVLFQDRQLLSGDIVSSLVMISVKIVAINVAIVFVSYIREKVTTRVTLKMSCNLKKMLYEHILKLSYKSYHSYSKVEMLQRVNDDAQEYSNFFKYQFNLILDIINLSFFIVTQGVLLSTSITIYLIVTITMMLLFAIWYYKKLTQLLEKVIVKKKKMLGQTIDNINQFKLIRIYNRQKEEIQKYKRLNKDYTQEDLKFIKLILFYEIVSEHITYLCDPIICLLGGISIIQGNMTLGELTAFLLLAKKVLNTCYSFGENLEVVNRFLVVKKKIKKLMDLKEEKNEKESYDLNGDITFHNVSMNIAKKEIFSNLNFVIKKGEKVAMVGENGSGKSMLAKAILGYYPIQGNIYLNDHNSKRLNQSNIREYIDFISGEADLFTGTILENIVLDRKSTKEEVTKVLKEVEIYKDIQKFEQGLETRVGEKGVKLSGGQKQRILMARAFIRNRPIMIFDSIFSKLDKETTNKIFQNLIKKYPQTTMIFITHKLEIENEVDKIIQLNKEKRNEGKNEIKE